MMEKEFNDSEFRMYGNLQSFFYRCWSMWGSHPRANTTTATNRKLEMMRHWCGNLFETTYYSNVTLNRALGYEVFVVDLRQNLEDYDFYNIKWVSNVETNLNRLSETPTHTYKAVPKVF